MQTEVNKELSDIRHTKVSKILVTQSKPADENSPYHHLSKKYNVQIDFRPFIEIEGVPYKEFRKQKIDITEFTAVILTSRNAVDHFFKLCKEAKIEMEPTVKYFCVSEQTANYLQKYIVLRKRKVFVGAKTASDLFDILKKHKNEKYLYPCSDIRNDDIPTFLRNNEFEFKEAIIYNTVPSDLSDIKSLDYDIIVFFSPSGVASLLSNFSGFRQQNIRLAAFGSTTAKAIKESGLHLDIEAPMPNAPSMTGALELYIKKVNEA